jgi:hypothetical protein
MEDKIQKMIYVAAAVLGVTLQPGTQLTKVSPKIVPNCAIGPESLWIRVTNNDQGFSQAAMNLRGAR